MVARYVKHVLIIVMGLALQCVASGAFGNSSLHTAPIIIQGNRILPLTRYPISMYRLYKSDAQGIARQIPFQIDEINQFGDFVLEKGPSPNSETGNGIFDPQDEISFMGDDVGPAREPVVWPDGKPTSVFELRLTSFYPNPMGESTGAVYVAVFLRKPPPLSQKKYVVFDPSQSEVITSRYKYAFDQKNWLVTRNVDVLTSEKPPSYTTMIQSSTFYMKADLKYFLTVVANHRTIDSALEAYRSGPIRNIVRVTFHYSFLRLKLELGMYTEISFFSNAVFLPAVVYNPVDGQKSLNKGSGMYYGMALVDNPNNYQIETNMPLYQAKVNILDLFKGDRQGEPLYWVSAKGKDRMMYLEFTPSADLQKSGVIPSLYQEDKPGSEIMTRSNKDAEELGRSPVNLGIYFDATRFKEGEHRMGFRLFFENNQDQRRLEVFKKLNDWIYEVKRLNI